MRWLTLALLIPALAGCGYSPGPRHGAGQRHGGDALHPVTIVRDHFHAGETATLRLRNPLAEPAGYNACTWTLERREADGWQTAPHEDERVCTMELRTLAAGESASPRFRFDERLPAGRYRLRLVLHALESDTREIRYSESFRIE
ncbi:MAG: hypothetical protein R3225_08010 [Halofilum sp. (in: g-proteobacteria)]|nr:hypothetical protein [Halofilum sp. (in: g-proteobacteria)]